MSRALLPFPLYVFMAWCSFTGSAFLILLCFLNFFLSLLSLIFLLWEKKLLSLPILDILLAWSWLFTWKPYCFNSLYYTLNSITIIHSLRCDISGVKMPHWNMECSSMIPMLKVVLQEKKGEDLGINFRMPKFHTEKLLKE